MPAKRFQVLDALRGVAALGVLLMHISAQSGLLLVPHAYLAVDFFFVLSGFVLASAYEAKLQAGMPVRAFMWHRVVRLYPLIFLAAIIGAVGLSHVYMGPTLVLLFITSVLLIPTPFGAESLGQPIMALNDPSWSLFWEMVINFVFGILAPRLSDKILCCIVLVSACFLTFADFHFGNIAIGSEWPSVWGGEARVCFSFFAGVGIWRLRRKRAFDHVSLPLPVLTAAMMVIFILPRHFLFVSVFDLIVVTLVFPLFIVMGANAPTGRYAAVCRISGDLSYPIYVLQSGLMVHMQGLPRHLHLYGTAAVPVLLGEIILFSLFSFFILQFYDVPVRGWLMGLKFRPRLTRS